MADRIIAAGKQKAAELMEEAGKERSSTPKTHAHSDYTRAHEKKSVRVLSDEELNAKINRLQKEKQYELTAKGREILEQWLAVPNESTPHQKDIFSLKMYFIEDRSDPRVSELLTYQIQVIEKHLRHLEKRKEELFSETDGEHVPYGQYLILSRAIERNQSQLQWLQNTIQNL